MSTNISANEARFLFSIAGEKFGVLGFQSYEAISKPYYMKLRLVSEDAQIDFSQMMDKSAVLTFSLLKDGVERYLHGIVNRFEQREQHNRFTIYHATVISPLWYLTQRFNCRIFQYKSAKDIIEEILKEALPTLKFKFRLDAALESRDYCVQYRESEFAFICRLLEEEGIFYFFEHSQEGCDLIFADGSFAHHPIPNDENVIFNPQHYGQVGDEHISQFFYAEQICSGKVSLRDFNFKRPFTPEGEQMTSEHSELEIYDYPGRFQEGGQGSRFAKIRLEEQQTKRKVANGQSFCTSLIPGYYFNLEEHSRNDFNQRYLLTELRLRVEQPQVLEETGSGSTAESIFDSQFECIPFSVPFRPAKITPKPIMRGTQTAIVVGESGDEIYTNKHGEIKVQFHWDREGQNNDKSSCWIRVSQQWAGIGWGGINIPRVGQEVIVDFLEDDPDRPIVTGRVYNGKHTTPYSLPSEKTKSTLKSRSSPGGRGFNEIRFEDKKGKEQLFFHAEKDYDLRVKHDRREYIGNDHSLIVKKDVQHLIEERQNVTVKKDNRLYVEGSEYHYIKKDLHQKIRMKYLNHAGTQSHFKAGQKIVIDAGMDITLKAGGSFIRINASGVTIKGSMVKINSGGSAGKATKAQAQTPSQPDKADNAKPGKQDKPKSPAIWAAKVVDIATLSAQSLTFKKSAKDGTPFCEECEKKNSSPPLVKNSDAKEKLSKTIADVLDDDDVQPKYPASNGNTNTTWCNRAAHRILDKQGYDTSGILNNIPDTNKPHIGYTSANSMAKNAANSAKNPNSGVKELTEAEAKKLANQGVPVMAVASNPKGHGHVGIVAASDGDKTMISQAGSKVGTRSVEISFKGLNPVKYYQLPKKSN